MWTDHNAQGPDRTCDVARVSWEEKISRTVSGFVGVLRIPRSVSDMKPGKSLVLWPGLLMCNLGAHYNPSESFKGALTKLASVFGERGPDPGTLTAPLFVPSFLHGASQGGPWVSRIGLTWELVRCVDSWDPSPYSLNQEYLSFNELSR